MINSELYLHKRLEHCVSQTASKSHRRRVDGQPEQELNIILINYTSSARNGEWRALERFVEPVEVIAAFVGTASLSGVTVARDPLLVQQELPLLEYKLPHGYSDQRLYATRKLLSALIWSVIDKEEASRHNGLAKYWMGASALDLPDRVLTSNQEVAQYVIAFLLDLDSLPEIPEGHKEEDVAAAISLALEAVLDQDYGPSKTKNHFEEMVREALTPIAVVVCE